MYSADKSGFKKFLLEFYTQIEKASEITKDLHIKFDSKNITNIIYLGMGGSAIAGDLLNDVLYGQLKVPITVVRGYSVPASCRESSLVIASSYSGDTEETLSAVDHAAKSGASFVVISSGGKLKVLAIENNWTFLGLPTGFPPRQALGFTFFSLYHMLGKSGLVTEYQDNMSDLIKFIKEQIHIHDTQNHHGHVMAMELAKAIHNKIPVIYSTAPFLSTISRRWQNQMHENAKSMAFCNVLPEMNHNEIVGWEMNTDIRKSMIAIFLENDNFNPRIGKRIELSKTIIRKCGAEVVDVYSTGANPLEKTFSLIVLGDWVSYYLALLNGKDPYTIANINYLKDELSKTA